MSDSMFLGVCHQGGRYDRMREAGIEWVRLDVPFPWADEIGNERPQYAKFREKVREYASEGFKVLGITPYPRNWNVEAGELGSAKFLSVYREACAYMARDLAFNIPIWQVCNELNLGWFRRPFETEEEAIPYLIEGGLGCREGNPEALVGVNMATGHEPSAYRMYRALYPNDRIDWDYVGMDAYYGTWEEGGPDTWPEKMAELYEVCKKPLIIMEFGYASGGGTMTAEERGPQNEGSQLLHKVGKWPWGWGEGHTPEMQAEYARIALEHFRRADYVLGAFWYKWSNGAKCNCGHQDCPENSHYGMTTIDEEPKPAYFEFQQFAARLKNAAPVGGGE